MSDEQTHAEIARLTALTSTLETEVAKLRAETSRLAVRGSYLPGSIRLVPDVLVPMLLAAGLIGVSATVVKLFL